MTVDDLDQRQTGCQQRGIEAVVADFPIIVDA
jgi:hypothetical protein